MKRILIFIYSDYYAQIKFETEQEAIEAFGELNTDITRFSKGFSCKLTV